MTCCSWGWVVRRQKHWGRGKWPLHSRAREVGGRGPLHTHTTPFYLQKWLWFQISLKFRMRLTSQSFTQKIRTKITTFQEHKISYHYNVDRLVFPVMKTVDKENFPSPIDTQLWTNPRCLILGWVKYFSLLHVRKTYRNSSLSVLFCLRTFIKKPPHFFSLLATQSKSQPGKKPFVFYSRYCPKQPN